MHDREPQDEYRRVRELLTLTSRVVDEPPNGDLDGWLVDLRDNFAHLRAHLYMHIAMEEHSGFLQPVTDRRPTLSANVEQLREKHRAQLALADRIHADLGCLLEDGRTSLEDCRHRIHQLISAIRDEARAKAMLISSAFCFDLGGEG